MKINPYLNFDGNAKEAMEFYAKVFKSKLTPFQYFKDMPPGENPMPAEEGNRVIHVGLEITPEVMIMASDISPSMGHKLNQGNGVYINLAPDSLEEAERLYRQLSDGGKIELELQKMFWGDHFASFADKFGVLWMINYHEEGTK